VEPGKWGLIAGDATGTAGSGDVDRQIAESQSIVWATAGTTSSWTAWCPMRIFAIWASNAGGRAACERGDILTAALSISPPRADRAAARAYRFAGGRRDGRRGVGVRGEPDGGNCSRRGTRRAYHAGTATSNCMDVVEAWESTEALCRAYVNVISLDASSGAGKAIVIAGRKSAENPLGRRTDYLANFAYNALLYRDTPRQTWSISTR